MLFFKTKKVLSAFMSLTMIGTIALSIPFTASAATISNNFGVSYQVHGQSYGWSQGIKSNGAMAGTSGQSKRVEALKIKLTGTGLPTGASIIYQVNGQSYGWQSPRADNIMAGTSGLSKRVEAIRITLKNMPDYKVTYRVHQQTYGWSVWKTTTNGTAIANADVAGVIGESKRVEALQIMLIKPSAPTVTAATVTTAAQLNTALANNNITTINLAASLTASPVINRPLTLNFGSNTLTGNVSFSYTAKGTAVLTGNSGNRILGNLSVNTANASFTNGVTASGTVTVANVATGTFTESASGNTLNVTDPDGTSITVTGNPAAINILLGASGNLMLNVNSGATVGSIVSKARVSATIASGATVTSFAASKGSDGSTITNNGTIGTVIANVPINLVANVAPTQTVTAGSGSVTVTGTQAGKVVITSGSVTGITVTGANNLASVAVGHTLQMNASIAPATAADKTVVWSVSTLSGGLATINSSTGLLTAITEGTVLVTATNTTSNVTGKLIVTITSNALTVGAQSTALAALTASQYATFPVTGANIGNGYSPTISWYTSGGALTTAPAGITAFCTTFSNNSSTVSLTANYAAAGTYYFKVTVGNVTSALVPVIITGATSICVAGQSGTLNSGASGTASFAVTTSNIADYQSLTVYWCDVYGNALSSVPTGLYTPNTVTVFNNSSSITVYATAVAASNTYYIRASYEGKYSSIIPVTISGETVTVSAQSGAITAGVSGTATFTLATTNIANGKNPTINWINTPAGISSISLTPVSNNTASITIYSGTASTTGTYYFTVTVDNATSLPIAYSVSSGTISVYGQNGTITAGSGGTATFTAMINGAAGAAPTITWVSGYAGLNATASPVSNNYSTIIVTATNIVPKGTYTFTVTAGGVTSSVVTVTVS